MLLTLQIITSVFGLKILELIPSLVLITPMYTLDFGEINQVQNIVHNPKKQIDDNWLWNAPLPQPIWQISETYSINITDVDLKPGVTYQVTITTPNGVADEHIFSVLGNP